MADFWGSLHHHPQLRLFSMQFPPRYNPVIGWVIPCKDCKRNNTERSINTLKLDFAVSFMFKITEVKYIILIQALC
jgi:hypothetical protein